MDWHQDSPTLRCFVEFEGDTARVLPVGEIDIGTAPVVEERLEAARSVGVAHIVLDLRETTFMDSTGLHLLLRWHGRARNERFSFGLIQGPDAVRRVVEITGIAPLLTFVE